MNETSIMNSIRIALSKWGIVIRINSGNFKTFDDRYVRIGINGCSDLLFIGDGYVAFIEVKMPNGRTSPAQEQFIGRVRALGHRAGVARSVEEALKIIGM